MNPKPRKHKAAPTSENPTPREDTQTQPATEFTVTFTRLALSDLATVSDLRTRQTLLDKANGLKHEPLRQGKPMTGDLKTYRSVRAAGQRYRVVYQVAVSAGAVVVLVIGIRKEGDKRDVYQVARKRLT